MFCLSKFGYFGFCFRFFCFFHSLRFIFHSRNGFFQSVLCLFFILYFILCLFKLPLAISPLNSSSEEILWNKIKNQKRVFRHDFSLDAFRSQTENKTKNQNQKPKPKPKPKPKKKTKKKQTKSKKKKRKASESRRDHRDNFKEFLDAHQHHHRLYKATQQTQRE